MTNSRKEDTKRRLDQSIKLTAESEQPMSTIFEPYVDTDRVAAFISEPRKNVIRMARERKLTCYPTSGRRRFTYKFKLSEVSKDIEKLRRPCSPLSNDNPQIKGSSRTK